MAEYCKGIIYASKVRQNSLSELSIGDFKIDCFINWVCVLFQLFYSVTVDSFWQFRINSFLGCALVLRGRRSQRDIQCPLDTAGYPEIQSVHCTHVQWCGQCHMASCLSHQKTAQFDWYLLCRLARAGLVVQTRDGHHHQWTRAGAPGEAEAHTSHSHQQIRSAAIIDYASQNKDERYNTIILSLLKWYR